MTSLLERWLDELDAAGALIGNRQATAARLEGWVPWLEAAARGDEAAQAELLRIVAFDARNLAQEGRPVSTVLWQPLLLEEAWPGERAEGARLSRLLVRVAADAHALGTAAMMDARQRALLARRSPVIPIGARWLGFMLGPMAEEVIDGVIGRLLQAAAGSGSTDVALDICGAEPPNALFVRTLEGFATADTGPVSRLTVTGAPSESNLAADFAARGVKPERVAFAPLSDWLPPSA